MTRLAIALVHHPVLDKNGQIVTTAVTNMDIHDIARSAATYGVRRFYVVTPVKALRRTWERRPDLLAQAELTDDERAFLDALRNGRPE